MYDRWVDLGMQRRRVDSPARRPARADRRVHRRRGGRGCRDSRFDRGGDAAGRTRRGPAGRLRRRRAAERPAPRFHGAEPHGAADHHAERPRRAELHPLPEDGSLPDVPHRDRPRGVRCVPAAVYDASESGDVRRQLVAASAGDHRLHGVSRGDGAIDRLRSLLAHARNRGADARVGGAVRLGGAPPVGLSDAAHRHDRGVVREVPHGHRLRGRGGEPEPGVWPLRARRVLRLPHDHGLHRICASRVPTSRRSPRSSHPSGCLRGFAIPG